MTGKSVFLEVQGQGQGPHQGFADGVKFPEIGFACLLEFRPIRRPLVRALETMVICSRGEGGSLQSHVESLLVVGCSLSLLFAQNGIAPIVRRLVEVDRVFFCLGESKEFPRMAEHVVERSGNESRMVEVEEPGQVAGCLKGLKERAVRRGDIPVVEGGKALPHAP